MNSREKVTQKRSNSVQTRVQSYNTSACIVTPKTTNPNPDYVPPTSFTTKQESRTMSVHGRSRKTVPVKVTVKK